MTAETLATNLDGIEYGNLVGFNNDVKAIFEEAKMNDFVIVFGASDDLMEFRGAIDDEAGCYDGEVVTFNKSGVCDGEFNFGNNSIDALWCENLDGTPSDIAWQYRTNIPHETFKVLEDGEVYSIGIVFSVIDLK